MARTKKPFVARTDEEIRRIMLRYFYDRNKNATSMMGKKGSAVKTSDLKSELKAAHGLLQKEVQSNLTYLLSQGWVEEKPIAKTFTPKGGSVVSSVTNYYVITAAGIDKIDGPGEFTMDKFHGIKIEATGQNIITVGDGNQIDSKFGNIGEALADLRKAITDADVAEAEKLTYVADIETIQSQLAKPAPNRNIVTAAWETVKGASAINGCATFVTRVASLIGEFIS
ncbi:MAG: hypothetical protein NPIRA04_12450 [Nitrospirales bacterium]|nr:MAG: hypothetical protein NPIRA04_12450 [Nitrospirales bacterium]